MTHRVTHYMTQQIFILGRVYSLSSIEILNKLWTKIFMNSKYHYIRVRAECDIFVKMRCVHKSSWRNRLARSTVNREVVGSIPTEDAFLCNSIFV